MPSSASTLSRLFTDPQWEAAGPPSPGSDTSTLIGFDSESTPSPGVAGKAAALISPTETLADHPTDPEELETPFQPRQSTYLDRIEKILSAELNPFDLLARDLSELQRDNPVDASSHRTEALFPVAVRGTRLDMQNSSPLPQSFANASASGELSQDAQRAAFYDPSSADGYSAPMQGSLLNTAPAFASPSFSHASSSSGSPAPAMLGAPNAFRDNTVYPSPSSSPNLAALSPALSHHQAASSSSDIGSPSGYGAGFLSDPSLSHTVGQIGQITLEENSSDSTGSSAYVQSGSMPSSIPASQSAQATSSAPQLTLGMPSVNVTGASTDYTPVAASSNTFMPSINVMAPSPSTPRPFAQGGQDGGFQDILAQLAAPGSDAGLNQRDAATNWLGSDQATTLQQEPFNYASTSDSALPQSNPAQVSFRPHSASGRIIPSGYSEEPTQMMSALAGSGTRNLSVHAPGQWSSQAKRQDSYDKIRQFLRLDVDMGFQSAGKTESPTLATFRKRANSDVGPRSPVVAGNAGGSGSAFDWSLAATNQADVKADNGPAELVWSNMNDSQDAFAQSAMQSTASQLQTMDPSLLSGTQLPVAVSQGFGNNTNLLLQHQQHLQQIQEQSQQQQQQQQMMQPVFQLNGQSNNMAAANFSMQVSAPGPNEFNPGWRFPGDGSQDGSGVAPMATKLRRARSSSGGHRRLAHSEDLSRSRMYQGADEDFLAQITAPNGGLAPPASGRAVSPNSGNVGGHHHTMSGSARVHPYRHERHYSFGSNASNSSAGSASPLPQMGLVYDQAGNLVQYPVDATGTMGFMGGMGMDGIPHSPSASSVASAASSQSMLAPPVPVVTSQATQAASASRRKSEALFACPIPGCGSTFTRQYNLRGHLRSHADERPYKCDWPGCDKSFARSHDCKRHQNLHLNIKPHTCEQCGKTFARLDALNRHHKSDTGGCLGKSDGESTNSGSSVSGAYEAAGSQPGSVTDNAGGQNWLYSSAGANVPSAGVSQPSKTFGGHVL